MAAPALQPVQDMIAEAVLERLRPELERLRIEVEKLRGEQATLVELPEAARRLGVTLRTAQRWVKSGQLKTEQVGGARRVRLPAGLPGGSVADP